MLTSVAKCRQDEVKVTASDDEDGRGRGRAIARTDTERDKKFRRAVAAQRARESSHRRNAHGKEGGIGHSCLLYSLSSDLIQGRGICTTAATLCTK